MPVCHLSVEGVEKILALPRGPRVCYHDKDLKGFILERRADGSCIWHYRFRRNGSLHFVHLGSLEKLSPVDARGKAYAVRDALLRGCANPDLSIASLRNFIERIYLPHIRWRKRSWKKDRQMLESHIFPVMGDFRLNLIGTSDIIAWQDGLLAKGFAPSTCNRILSLLKCIFRHAHRFGFLEKNPAAGVAPLKIGRIKGRYLTPSEGQALMDVLEQKSSVMFYAAIRLLLLTGARKNEIFAARREDVDMERRFLTVPLSKSGRTRYIPLSDAALDVLKSLPPSDSPWLFPSSQKEGQHLSFNYVRWDNLRRSLSLQNFRLHDLRHSFAGFLVSGGRSLYEVQTILGHGSPKVTMRYAHFLGNTLREAAECAAVAVGRGKNAGQKADLRNQCRENR